jgi:hypothetical protein
VIVVFAEDGVGLHYDPSTLLNSRRFFRSMEAQVVSLVSGCVNTVRVFVVAKIWAFRSFETIVMKAFESTFMERLIRDPKPGILALVHQKIIIWWKYTLCPGWRSTELTCQRECNTSSVSIWCALHIFGRLDLWDSCSFGMGTHFSWLPGRCSRSSSRFLASLIILQLQMDTSRIWAHSAICHIDCKSPWGVRRTSKSPE